MREEGYEDCFQTSQKYMEKDNDFGLEVAKHLWEKNQLCPSWIIKNEWKTVRGI